MKSEINKQQEINPFVEDIKYEIAKMKRSRKFYTYYDFQALHVLLNNILQMIKSHIQNSETAIELLSQFFTLDKHCVEHCDDNGYLSDIFQYDATNLFIYYAQNYIDKNQLTKIVYKIINNNEYSMRDGILENLKDILPEENLVSLLKLTYNYSYAFDEIVFALRNAPMYETIIKEEHSNHLEFYYYKLSKCYFDYGDIDKSLEYALVIPNQEDRIEMLEQIYTKQNNKEELFEAYKNYYYETGSEKMLSKIKKIFGQDKVDEIIQIRINIIIKEYDFIEEHVLFLLKYNVEYAEQYIYNRKDKLKGLQLKATFTNAIKKKCSPLIQTIICRIPLQSYLAYGKSKYYGTAANYLAHIIKIAPLITDWKDVLPHEQFVEQLYQTHKLKKLFWSYFDM